MAGINSLCPQLHGQRPKGHMSVYASRGWAGADYGHAPLSPPRQSRRAFAGGHAPSRCAVLWRGSRRVALGAGRGRSGSGPRGCTHHPAAGCRGRGAGNPGLGGTPFGTRAPASSTRHGSPPLAPPGAARRESGHLTFRYCHLLGFGKGCLRPEGNSQRTWE